VTFSDKVSVLSFLWNVVNSLRARAGKLSIHHGETNNVANSVFQLEQYVTAFLMDLVISNDSPSRTVTIQNIWLEIPWRDDFLHPLADPADLGRQSVYRFSGSNLEYPHDMVINHRRLGHGKLAPGETIAGMFLVQGTAPVPFDLYGPEWIRVTVCVLDASGKIHRSTKTAVWPGPSDPGTQAALPPNPIARTNFRPDSGT
jgi:hypothetical protein